MPLSKLVLVLPRPLGPSWIFWVALRIHAVFAVRTLQDAQSNAKAADKGGAMLPSTTIRFRLIIENKKGMYCTVYSTILDQAVLIRTFHIYHRFTKLY